VYFPKRVMRLIRTEQRCRLMVLELLRAKNSCSIRRHVSTN